MYVYANAAAGTPVCNHRTASARQTAQPMGATHMLVQPDQTAAVGGRRATAKRTDELREALRLRYDELTGEYRGVVAEMTVAGAVDAGDDVADLGTKAFSREQEFALAITLKSQMDQVERALERLDAGSY